MLRRAATWERCAGLVKSRPQNRPVVLLNNREPMALH